MNNQKSTAGVEAVNRALRILLSFRQGRTALTLSEIARETGLYKSTVLRIANSLEREGFLTRGEDLHYRPGRNLWHLASLVPRSADRAQIIRPVLARLVAQTGETASFYIRDGQERVCLYRHNSPKSARHHLDEGVRLPIGTGAAGKILTAYSDLAGPDDEKIVAAGYSVSLGERDPEVGAIAVPVLDPFGQLLGALSISAIITRFTPQARQVALDVLREGAKMIEVGAA